MEAVERPFIFYRQKKNFFCRTDVWPFLFVAYPIFLALMANDGVFFEVFGAYEEEVLDVVAEGEVADTPQVVARSFDLGTIYFLLLALLLVVHLLTYLSTHWNVFARAYLRFDKVSHIDKATHAIIWPALEKRQIRIVPLRRCSRGDVSVDVDKEKLVWNGTCFKNLEFPSSYPISHYLKSCGETGDVTEKQERYGENNYDLVLPTFMELMKEHAVKPFFVFQVGTMFLWLLDDMWQYAMMTLLMLVGLEAQVVNKRLQDMAEMRNMRLKTRDVYVHRRGKWVLEKTDNIVPGDIFLLTCSGNKEDDAVPCDALILSGEAVLNECLLTGESVPCVKTAVDADDSGATLDLLSTHKQNAVFAGTVTVAINISAERPDGIAPLPTEQQPVVLCYAIWTGFNTSQGSLVRTILFSSERVTVDSMEAFVFLGLLLIVGIAASTYVFVVEWRESARSRFRLLLSCILILTSVVPPEFPVTLSMAVNLSLVQMLRARLHCTEPFRVPFAGQVSVCCFDKTGTLTSDRMRVLGVIGIESPHSDSSQEIVTHIVDDKQSTKSDTSARKEAASSDMSAALRQPLPFTPAAVMAGCHALALVKESTKSGVDRFVPRGDAMEVAAVTALASQWTLISATSMATMGSSKNDEIDRLTIVKRFAFNSNVQRMTVLTKHTGPCTAYTPPPARSNDNSSHPPPAPATYGAYKKPARTSNFLILSKGAPEVMKQFFVEVPSWYDDLVSENVLRGRRLLALGTRWVPTADESKCIHWKRDQAENSLEFAGFLVLGTPVKKNTVKSIRELRESSHRCVMITGDHPTTAAQVARDIKMFADEKSILVLAMSDDDVLRWQTREGTYVSEFDKNSIADLASNSALVTTGAVIDRLDKEALQIMVKHANVFARVAPAQKELLLHTLVDIGEICLMVGDGTNDVGALKVAHIGISLISGAPETQEEKKKELQKLASNNDPSAAALLLPDGSAVSMPQLPPPLQKRWMTLKGQVGVMRFFGNSVKAQMMVKVEGEMKQLVIDIQKWKDGNPEKMRETLENQTNSKAKKTVEQQARWMESLQSRLENIDDEDLPVAKLGDASVASPFAYKGDDIRCVPLLMRMGRATLSTVLLMYLLMALNSLITAFVMSALTMDGVKFGDFQSTVESFFVSILVLASSRAPPSESLSPMKPTRSIFSRHVFTSFIMQSTIHLGFIYTAWQLAITARGPDYDPDLDGTFRPNLTNTTMYIILASMHAASFLANYDGEPFVQSMSKNTGLYRGLQAFTACLLIVTWEVFPDVNNYLSLVPLPSSEYRNTLLLYVFGDLALSIGIGRLCIAWGRWVERRAAAERLKHA